MIKRPGHYLAYFCYITITYVLHGHFIYVEEIFITYSSFFENYNGKIKIRLYKLLIKISSDFQLIAHDFTTKAQI